MLSIIIPALNEEKYLPFLLATIKKQSFKDFEVIVADAGSTDKTIEIAKDFGCKIIKGGLPAKGRNEGAKIAKGELFFFIDADSRIISETFLEKLLREFKKKDLQIAVFPIYLDGNGLDRVLFSFYNFWVKITEKVLPHATSTFLVKRDLHKRIGGFDQEVKLAEDHEYARRASKWGKFGFIKIEPVILSCRRFEREGRIKLYLKYILGAIYLLLFGSIKTDIFKYRFDKSLKN